MTATSLVLVILKFLPLAAVFSQVSVCCKPAVTPGTICGTHRSRTMLFSLSGLAGSVTVVSRYYS